MVLRSKDRARERVRGGARWMTREVARTGRGSGVIVAENGVEGREGAWERGCCVMSKEGARSREVEVGRKGRRREGIGCAVKIRGGN